LHPKGIEVFYFFAYNLKMINITYRQNNESLSHPWHPSDPLPDGLYWLDMVAPTSEEHIEVEKRLSIEIPSKTEVWKNNVLNQVICRRRCCLYDRIIDFKI
jgi:hypothetical protein